MSRVIYLDTDVIVRSDLGALFDVDLKLSPIAAAIDYPLVLAAERGEYISASGMRWRAGDYVRYYLGMTNIGTYFNAGILAHRSSPISKDQERSRAPPFSRTEGLSLHI